MHDKEHFAGLLQRILELVNREHPGRVLGFGLVHIQNSGNVQRPFSDAESIHDSRRSCH